MTIADKKVVLIPLFTGQCKYMSPIRQTIRCCVLIPLFTWQCKYRSIQKIQSYQALVGVFSSVYQID